MATNDLLTPAEADSALNLPSGSTLNDDQREQWVSAVSARIDDLCGPVVTRTITSERHIRPGRTHRLRLRNTPVDSVTTVVTWVAGSSSTLTAETDSTSGDYRLDTTAGQHAAWLVRRSGWTDRNWNLSGDVLVTYEAGRVASTAAVSPLFKTAAATILRRLRQREAGAWAIPADDPYAYGGVGFFKAVDPMVKELLGTELLPPSLGI